MSSLVNVSRILFLILTIQTVVVPCVAMQQDEVSIKSTLHKLYESTTRLITHHPLLCTIGGTVLIWTVLNYIFKDKEKARPIIEDAVPVCSFKDQHAIGQSVLLSNILFENSDSFVVQPQVAPQEGLSCGYHALKNGILLINQLAKPTHKDLSEKLLDKKLCSELFGVIDEKDSDYYFWESPLYGPWKQLIKDSNYRLGNHFDGNVEDICTGALEHLIENEKKYHRLLEENVELNISVVEDNKILGLDHGPLYDIDIDKNNLISPDYITTPVIENCLNAKKNSEAYSHLFILNTGKFFESTSFFGRTYIQGTANNHYFAVGLHQDKLAKRTYYVLDSLNIKRVDDESVQQLIAVIESGIEQTIKSN